MGQQLPTTVGTLCDGQRMEVNITTKTSAIPQGFAVHKQNGQPYYRPLADEPFNPSNKKCPPSWDRISGHLKPSFFDLSSPSTEVFSPYSPTMETPECTTEFSAPPSMNPTPNTTPIKEKPNSDSYHQLFLKALLQHIDWKSRQLYALPESENEKSYTMVPSHETKPTATTAIPQTPGAYAVYQFHNNRGCFLIPQEAEGSLYQWLGAIPEDTVDIYRSTQWPLYAIGSAKHAFVFDGFIPTYLCPEYLGNKVIHPLYLMYLQQNRGPQTLDFS